MRAKHYLIFDTETAGSFAAPQIYDLAWRVITKRGEIVSEHNYLIRDTITDPDKMMKAFYARKIFHFYIPALDARKISLIDFADAAALFAADAERSDVIAAYNFPFDAGAMRATAAATGAGRILKASIDRLCLWDWACRTALGTRLYADVARQNGWISEAGNVRTTAEHTFRFLTGNLDFIEGHTALDDVAAEQVIFTRLAARKKKMPINDITPMPWRLAQGN